jgi:hypothetical protein
MVNRSNHEDRMSRIVRLAGRAAQVALVVARVIQELFKVPW